MRACLLLVALCACSPSMDRAEAIDDAYTEMAEAIERFAVAADALQSSTDGLCTQTTEARVITVRDAWWTARGAYKQVSMAGFGPLEEEPDRLGPKLDFWPARPATIEALIASDTPLDAPAFGSMGTATRGLPAMEVVLYEEDAVVRWADDPRRCAFVQGAAGDIASNAHALEDAWGAWQTRLTEPDGEPYASTQEVLNEWVNRVAFAAEDIRLEKLGKPMGTGPDDVRPDAIESPWAHRSVADMTDTLDGAHRVLSAVLVAADDPTLAARADAAHEHARHALADLSEPLVQTLVVEPEIAQRAQEAVQAYQVLVQVDVAQALSVSVVFNDNDGD